MTKLRRKALVEESVAAKANETNLPVADIDLFPIDPEIFHEMVAERAYFKAQSRDFEPGREWDDWIEAEKELLGVPHSLSKGMNW